MKMKLIAAGAAVAMAAPLAAAADSEWYGRIHLSVDHYTDLDGRTVVTGHDDDSGDPNEWAEANEGTYFANNSSRIGFRGSKALDGGLTLLGQIESSVPVGGNWTANRDTYVGLDGDFGRVLVGQLPAANQYVYDVNFFADQVGDAGAAQGQGGGASEIGGRTLAIWYGLEPVDGLNVAATLLPAGQYQDADDGDAASGFIARAHYSMGPMAFGVTQVSAKDVVGADATALSFRMDYGQGDVGVSYTTFSSAADDMDNATLVAGGTFRLSDAGTLKAQYQTIQMDDSDTDDPTVISIGYDHALSGNVTGYVAYAMGSDGGNVHQWGHGDPALTASSTEADEGKDMDSTSVISFGMLYNF